MQIILMALAIYFSIPIVMLIAWDKCKAFALTPKESILFLLVWTKYLKGE